MIEAYIATFNHLLGVSKYRELDFYENSLYRQVAVTVKLKARLDELILQQTIEEVKNGKRTDTPPGGTSQQDSEIEEY